MEFFPQQQNAFTEAFNFSHDLSYSSIATSLSSIEMKLVFVCIEKINFLTALLCFVRG